MNMGRDRGGGGRGERGEEGGREGSTFYLHILHNTVVYMRTTAL